MSPTLPFPSFVFLPRFVRRAVVFVVALLMGGPLFAAISIVNHSSLINSTQSNASHSPTINSLGGGMTKRYAVCTIAASDDNTNDLGINYISFDTVTPTLVTGTTATVTAGRYVRTMIYWADITSLGAGGKTVQIQTSGACENIYFGYYVIESSAALTVSTGTANTSSSSTTLATSISPVMGEGLVLDLVGNYSSSTSFTATGTSQTITTSPTTSIRNGTVMSCASSTRAITSGGDYSFSYSFTSGGAGSAHSLAAFGVTAPTYSISGNVFEDTTYAGGVGRSKATSSGTNVSGARVELFNSSGNFVSATTTNASGNYTFSSVTGGNYTVRCVGTSVVPVGGTSASIPVQTYRTTATTGSVVAVTDRVGGEDPAKSEAANGSTTLAALTTGSATPQSITTITGLASNLTGVDFGYNFNTITNTNDTGGGSLRQFVTNAVDISGANSSIFMISDGTARPGLRSGLTNQLTSGVAVITLATALPTISGTNGASTTIDGGTQTTNIGNTNTGTLGTGGTVGVDAITLPTLNKPEVELSFATSINGNAIQITASSVTVKNIAIHGTSGTSAVLINMSGSSVVVSDCAVGITASSLALPSTNPTGRHGLRLAQNNATSTRNIIAYCGERGIATLGGLSGTTVTYNEIAYNGLTDGVSALLHTGHTSSTVQYNLIRANKGLGYLGTGNTNLINNNTISGNGVGSTATSTAGLNTDGNSHTISRNIITNNYGNGIHLEYGTYGITISQNSIYNNGTSTNDSAAAATGAIGIDLAPTSDTTTNGVAPYYTLNDTGDSDTGANGLLNFPALERAYINGSNLTITGWAPTGATIEFFVADSDPSGFGEGQTYIGSVVEGGGSDANATTGSYTNPLNCANQGAESSVARFSYTFAKPSSVALGTKLTATATVAGATSEFSYVVTVGDGVPDITILNSSTLLSDPVNNTTNPKAIPGAVRRFNLLVTNTDDEPSDTDSVTLTCPIPSDTSLYVADLGGAGSGPVLFTDGSTASGLSYTFTALANTSDDIEFSNNNGSTYSYVPVADADGCDSSVTHVRLKPKGALARALCGNNPSCTFAFNLRVR